MNTTMTEKTELRFPGCKNSHVKKYVLDLREQLRLANIDAFQALAERDELIAAGDKLSELLGKGLVDDETNEALERWDNAVSMSPKKGKGI